MKETLARNIYRYRKEKGMTQEQLAQKLGLTFQAISRWETGKTTPDISYLPKLSQEFEISVDKLLGYISYDKQISIYEEKYQIDEYLWGMEPAALALKVLEYRPASRPLRLFNMGCREGQDAVFFARNGYDVTACDASIAGIEKAKKLAKAHRQSLYLFKTDIMDYRLSSLFDIFYSNETFHYIRPRARNEVLENYKEFTAPGGLHVVTVPVYKPYFAENSMDKNTTYWYSGELMRHYHDWEILESSETVAIHPLKKTKYAVDTIIAQRPTL